MDRHMAAALDRWLTTDPRDERSQCECGDDCEMVATDCGHSRSACETTRDRYDDALVVCRHHEPEPPEEPLNMWGTPKSDVGDGYCPECECAEPHHYVGCPVRVRPGGAA